MTLADRIVSTLSAQPAPFWTLRRLHDNGGAVREALRELAEQGRVTRDDTTELYHLVSESPETPAAEAEHVEAAGTWDLHPSPDSPAWRLPVGRSGLPASKIPGLEDEIRVLTLDDVAMPLVDAASAAAIVEAIEERSTATLPPPPPRGHPALGVGPSWSDRIAALEERTAWLGSEITGRIGLERITTDAQVDVLVRRNEALEKTVAKLVDRVISVELKSIPSAGDVNYGLCRLEERFEDLVGRVTAIETERARWAPPLLETLESVVRGLLTRVEQLEHPEPVGPVMTPPGIHVEALKERSAVVAWLRVFAASDIGAEAVDYLDAIANDVEAGKHHTVTP
jgi:hypothetical protein